MVYIAEFDLLDRQANHSRARNRGTEEVDWDQIPSRSCAYLGEQILEMKSEPSRKIPDNC